MDQCIYHWTIWTKRTYKLSFGWLALSLSLSHSIFLFLFLRSLIAPAVPPSWLSRWLVRYTILYYLFIYLSSYYYWFIYLFASLLNDSLLIDLCQLKADFTLSLSLSLYYIYYIRCPIGQLSICSPIHVAKYTHKHCCMDGAVWLIFCVTNAIKGRHLAWFGLSLSHTHLPSSNNKIVCIDRIVFQSEHQSTTA